jgi:hypothetical protein
LLSDWESDDVSSGVVGATDASLPSLDSASSAVPGSDEDCVSVSLDSLAPASLGVVLRESSELESPPPQATVTRQATGAIQRTFLNHYSTQSRPR